MCDRYDVPGRRRERGGGHLFTSEESARAWTATHPGTFVLPFEDAEALAEVWCRQVLPEVTPGDR